MEDSDLKITINFNRQGEFTSAHIISTDRWDCSYKKDPKGFDLEYRNTSWSLGNDSVPHYETESRLEVMTQLLNYMPNVTHIKIDGKITPETLPSGIYEERAPSFAKIHAAITEFFKKELSKEPQHDPQPELLSAGAPSPTMAKPTFSLGRD